MLQKKSWYLLLILVVGLALLISGCSWFKSPQQKPEQQPRQGTSAAQEPQISVYMHETGEKKNMKMDDYIAGVVAGEMKNDWPVEALAAQAIIARTFTVQAIEEKGGVPERGTQASTDIKEFQAYNAQAVNDNVRKAVQMTRGKIITYQGKPAKTWFHASAGGKTATAKEGLDYKDAEPPYIQSVDSPDDLAPDDIRKWSVAFTKDEIVAALKKAGLNVDRVESVEIGQKGPSGRAMTFTVNGNKSVAAPAVRIAIGSMELKSLLLDKVEVEGNKVIFTGKGYGHGVGMSQWGAHKMAKDGKTPEQIVSHYYRDVKIEQRWQ